MSVVFRDRATFACQDMYPHFPKAQADGRAQKSLLSQQYHAWQAHEFHKWLIFAVGIKCFGVDILSDSCRRHDADCLCANGLLGWSINGRRIWVLLGFLCATPFSFSHSLDILKVQYCY